MNVIQQSETVQRLYQAFGSGNMDEFFSLLDDSIVWHSHYTSNIPLNGKFERAEGLQRLLQAIGNNVEILSFAPHTFLENDSAVVVLGREEARVKATGKTYQNNWVHVFTFFNDKVISINTYNTTEVVELAFQAS